MLNFAGHEFSSLAQNAFNQHLLFRCADPGHGTDGFGHKRAMMGQREGQVRTLEGDLAAWGRGRGIVSIGSVPVGH